MENDQNSAQAPPIRVRLATFLFPPLGLVLLWRTNRRVWKKIFGTVFILFYLPVYAGVVLALLWRFCGLHFEMRGTPVPIPTFWPAVPDFAALEASRSARPRESAVPRAGGVYWTDFRGPDRAGIYAERPILTNWSNGGPKLLWKQPVGGGYASFVVANGRAFTIEQRRQQEAVTAYDLETGRELWAHIYDANFQEWMGGDGPRATPTWHNGRIYSLGALGEVRCLDATDGKLLWKHNILAENQLANLMYGMAASPLIVDDKVILLAGRPASREARTVLVYHKDSGELLWKAQDDTMAYSSPMLVTLAGERQILAVSSIRVMGLSLADGKDLWSFPWTVQYDNAIAQEIVFATNRFLISGGYGVGCAAVEVSRTTNGFSAKRLWANKNLKNKFASSVLQDGYVYGLDEDMLTCIDAATGERKWKDGRYGYGQLLLASGHLVILCGDGDLALVKATPDHWEEVARIPALKGKTWNNPAIADGRLLIRNAVEMACFDLTPK